MWNVVNFPISSDLKCIEKNLEEILKRWGGQRKGEAGNNQIEIQMSTIQNENGGGVASFWMFVFLVCVCVCVGGGGGKNHLVFAEVTDGWPQRTLLHLLFVIDISHFETVIFILHKSRQYFSDISLAFEEQSILIEHQDIFLKII